MAKYDINFTPNPEKGISYTVITDDSNDWIDVPINTYFYDKDTNLPYYKNSNGDILSVFSSGSGGGNTIYTANDTVGSGRVATLTDTLRFKDGTFEIQGAGTGTTLALYNGDATPTKTWEWLDNGNVNINQTSTLSLSTNKTLKIDGSSNTLENIFELNGGTNAFGTGVITVGSYGNVEIKGVNSLGNFKVLTMLGNEYFTLDGNGNNSTLRTKAFDIGTSTTTGYKIYEDSGRHEFVRLGIMGANFNLVNSDILFWEAGIDNKTFVVGGSTPIETEEISLQGNTLVSEKLELSSTDHGILLNRVDDIEMDGIIAEENEIVFNKDKEALYRWDGSAWVALAAGFGIVGTTDATGRPTFYATVKAAYEAGQGSVKLYSDITESVSRVIEMVNGRDIDLNGFTYTYSATDGSNMFQTSNQNCTFRIINGRLLRTNGASSTLLNFTGTQTQIDIINVYAENDNGKCLNTKAKIFNAYGSTFIGTIGITFTLPAKVSGGTYIALNGSSHGASAQHIQNAVFRVDGNGRTFATNSTVNNCEFYGEDNTALNSSGTVINSYIKSTTGTALSVGINCTIIGCTVISSGSRAATSSQPGSRIIKSTLITSSANSCVNNVEFVEDCNIIMNGTGGGITTSGRVVKAINNIIKINSGSGDGIFFSTLTNSQAIGNVIYLNDPASVGVTSNNTNVYISKNTVKGSTILSDLGTGTNLFTTATDAQGNSAQL